MPLTRHHGLGKTLCSSIMTHILICLLYVFLVHCRWIVSLPTDFIMIGIIHYLGGVDIPATAVMRVQEVIHSRLLFPFAISSSGNTTYSSLYGHKNGGFPCMARRHSSSCCRQVNVRMPLLVTSLVWITVNIPCYICQAADFLYHVGCDTAHFCQYPPVV